MGVTQETSLTICAHFKPITCYQDYHQSCQEHITNYLSGRSPPWCPGYQEDWAAAAARSIARLSTCAGESRQEEEGISIRGSYSPRASPRDASNIAHASHSPCSSAHDAIIIACHSPCATQPPNGGDVHIQAAENPEGPPTGVDEALLKSGPFKGHHIYRKDASITAEKLIVYFVWTFSISLFKYCLIDFTFFSANLVAFDDFCMMYL